MAQFSIKPNAAKRAEADLCYAQNSLTREAMKIEQVQRSRVLCGSRAFDAVRNVLKSTRVSVNLLEQKTQTMRTALLDVTNVYKKTELDILGYTNENVLPSEIQKGGMSSFRSWIEKDYKMFFGEEGESLTTWNLLKAYLTFKDKTESNSSAGLSKSAISYIKSLGSFFLGDMKGTEGFCDWCDLASSSSKLWTALYSYLRKFDPTKTDTDIGIFAKKWGRTSAGVSIVGNTIDFVGALTSAFDTDGKSGYEVAANFVGTGDELSQTIKSIYEFRHVGDISLKKGLHSSAGKYAIVASTTISTISQAIKSVGEYSADGTFDMKDLGATGIDASVSGLYTMTSELTFNIISEDTTGVSAKDVSTSIKGFADNWNKQAANYIGSDPALLAAYRKGNSLTKFSLECFARSKVNPFP